jgi:hypothetical protein
MFDTLQHDAEQIDLDITPGKFHISSWLYKSKLDMIYSFLIAGFSLGVYEVYEYEMVFYHLIYIGDMIVVHYRLIAEQRDGGLDEAQEKEVRGVEVRREVVRALMLVISVCGVNEPSGILYERRPHYEHRFRVLRQVGSPSAKGFDDFTADVGELRGIGILERLENAGRGFKMASCGLDKLIKEGSGSGYTGMKEKEELMAMKRVCIANSIGIQAFLKEKEGGDGGLLKVEIDRVEFKYHVDYPVVFIK